MHNSNSSWLSYCIMSSLICMSNTEWKSTNTRRGITWLKCGFYEVKRARFFRQPPRVSRFTRMECAFLCNTYPKQAFNPAGALRRLLALLRSVCCKSGCQMPLLLLIQCLKSPTSTTASTCRWWVPLQITRYTSHYFQRCMVYYLLTLREENWASNCWQGSVLHDSCCLSCYVCSQPFHPFEDVNYLCLCIWFHRFCSCQFSSCFSTWSPNLSNFNHNPQCTVSQGQCCKQFIIVELENSYTLNGGMPYRASYSLLHT